MRRLRLMISALVVTVLCIQGLLLSHVSHGEPVKGGLTEGHDYYAGDEQELLHNVEKHHLPQAINELRAGQFQYAWGDLDFVLRYFPNHPKALLLMSELSTKTNKPQQADAYFKKALEVNPNISTTYMVYGIYQHKTKQTQKAIDSYKKAVELDESSSEAHYNLGLAYSSVKKYEEANKHAQIAYALGYPLPGLKKQLLKAGAWKPHTEEAVSAQN